MPDTFVTVFAEECDLADSRANVHQVVARVERQHQLIEALRVRRERPVRAADLARDLGVSIRTVERDLAALTAAGLPVVVRRGPGGGYRLAAEGVPVGLDLTTGEIAALIASLTAIGPYSSATARSALDKLLAALA